VRIFGKAEWLNPGGSVKDRPAWAIVRAGLASGEIASSGSASGESASSDVASGEIASGEIASNDLASSEAASGGSVGEQPAGEGIRRRLLDASSGNTAIGYAMLGAAVGFGVTLCVPANASRDRLRTLRAYGAEVVLTDPLEGSDGAIVHARTLAAARPELYWYADQYGNPENWRSHYRTTAEEIWQQTGGEITHFVAGLGTTGTLTGTARRLRELRPGIGVAALQPEGALHGIEGLKHLDSSIRPGIYDDSLVDLDLRVATEEAQEAARRLAREAGLLVGTSSGAAWTACCRLAEELESGLIVTVLPDGGERYLDQDWWAS